ALRDVIRHCLYAVDKNPLAVDLCKVALWIESHSPGMPLSFLDHRIRCGDSLVGVLDLNVLKEGVPDAAFKPLTDDDKGIATLLRRRNQQECARPLDAFARSQIMENFARLSVELAEMPDETPDQVSHKAACYGSLHEAEGEWRQLQRACDFWTAAFFA